MPQRLLFLLSDFHVVALSVWRRPCVAFLPFCVSLRIFLNLLVLIDTTEPRLLFQPLSSEAKDGPSGFEIEASFLRNSQRLPWWLVLLCLFCLGFHRLRLLAPLPIPRSRNFPFPAFPLPLTPRVRGLDSPVLRPVHSSFHLRSRLCVDKSFRSTLPCPRL